MKKQTNPNVDQHVHSIQNLTDEAQNNPSNIQVRGIFDKTFQQEVLAVQNDLSNNDRVMKGSTTLNGNRLWKTSC